MNYSNKRVYNTLALNNSYKRMYVCNINITKCYLIHETSRILLVAKLTIKGIKKR